MANNNPDTKNHNTKTRKKNQPGYKRVLVGYKDVPMQSTHLATPGGTTRCRLCWLLNKVTPTPGQKSKDHFCRWNFARENPNRDPNPPMRRVPIYEWVKD